MLMLLRDMDVKSLGKSKGVFVFSSGDPLNSSRQVGDDARQPQNHLHGPASRWAQATLLAVIVFFSLLAMRGLGAAYSYWNDEIFAVFPTTLPWSNLYRHWLLPDVHPPLYNFFLKLWTGAFGVSETLTRIPSMAFAVASILALYRFTRDRPLPARLFALSFLGSLPAWAYFAQEVRSYSLALLLASAVTYLALILRRLRLHGERSGGRVLPLLVAYYLLALALGLTHYYGLIFVLLITAINFFERLVDANRLRILGFVAVNLYWPYLHARTGKLLSHTGGRFWIKVDPVVGTIRNYLEANFPLLLHRGEFVIPLVVLLVVLAVAVLAHARPSAAKLLAPAASLGRDCQESRYLSLLIGLFLLATTLLDLRSPSSTARNFIVLVPATVIVLTNLFTGVLDRARSTPWLRAAVLGLALLLITGQTALSMQRLEAKSMPRQNWKEMGLFARSSDLCVEGCELLGTDDLFTRLYFGDTKRVSIAAEALASRGHRLDPAHPLIGFHDAYLELPAIQRANPELQCWEPRQADANAVFVFLNPRQVKTADPASHGFASCRTVADPPYFWTGR